jgi:hypothetical protein
MGTFVRAHVRRCVPCGKVWTETMAGVVTGGVLFFPSSIRDIQKLVRLTSLGTLWVCFIIVFVVGSAAQHGTRYPTPRLLHFTAGNHCDGPSEC